MVYPQNPLYKSHHRDGGLQVKSATERRLSEMATATKVRWVDRLSGHTHEDLVYDELELECMIADPDMVILCFEDASEDDDDSGREEENGHDSKPSVLLA